MFWGRAVRALTQSRGIPETEHLCFQEVPIVIARANGGGTHITRCDSAVSANYQIDDRALSDPSLTDDHDVAGQFVRETGERVAQACRFIECREWERVINEEVPPKALALCATTQRGGMTIVGERREASVTAKRHAKGRKHSLVARPPLFHGGYHVGFVAPFL